MLTMIKFFILIVIIISIILIFIFWKTPKVNELESPNILGFVLGSTSEPKNNTKGLDLGNQISQTKDSVNNLASNTINDVKDSAYSSTKNILDSVFDKKDTSKLNVNFIENKKVSETMKLHLIDLAKDDMLKIQIQKNDKYYLKFKSVPADYCLYIKDNKYEIKDEAVVEIQFNSSGNYSLKMSSCNILEKNVGEIVVQ